MNKRAFFLFIAHCLLFIVHCYAVALLLMLALHAAAPQRNGLLAVSQIFAPYLFAPLLLLLPLVFARVSPALRWLLLLCGMLFALRYAPDIAWGQPPANSAQLHVLSWNMMHTNGQLGRIRYALLNAGADIIALQELDTKQATAISNDPQLRILYPYQVLAGRSDANGMGVLSTYPLLEQQLSSDPAVLAVRVDAGGPRPLVVVNAHPLLDNPRLQHFASTGRDAQIRRIRELTSSLTGNNEALLLMGDFNVTVREPAYSELSAGLIDAHTAAGNGYGATWRPSTRLPLGLLRIDYLLAGPQLRPVSVVADCTPRGSDHCMLHGDFAWR